MKTSMCQQDDNGWGHDHETTTPSWVSKTFLTVDGKDDMEEDGR